ncbi:nuclear transport factor 2 family protein [Bradyrhizobium prioriisuperbiae]|uniref:nuclear transport factor 2 family protein n=1 Tax=Bradyrhizobium prioriisuperbiae TaxID=2854389 RepID=UPI0028E48388|nr:nuclear transport factor 2 family protein [Bradyrhizobium prioritasuperba]
MSSTDNKQLLQEIFEGLANRDGTLFIDSMTPECRWTTIGTGKWSGTFEGKPAILRDLLGPLRERLAERSKTVAQRFIVDGDFAAVEARGHNVTKAGAPYRNEYCFVFRFSGGKIAEVTEYSDTELISAVLGDPVVPLAAAG